MKENNSLTKRFFQMGYLNKMKVTVVYALLVILIISVFVVTIYRFSVSNYTQQQMGIAYQKPLTNLLIDLVRYPYPEVDKNILNQRINQNFSELKSSEKIPTELTQKIVFLQEEWDHLWSQSIEIDNKDITELAEMVQDLIRDVNQYAKLTFIKDSGTAQLAYIATAVMPDIVLILNRITNEVDQQKLELLNQTLINNTSIIQILLEQYQKSNPSKKEDISAWQDQISQLSALIKEGGTQEQVIPITLQTTSTTVNKLLNQIETSLSLQYRSISWIFFLCFVLLLIAFVTPLIFYIIRINRRMMRVLTLGAKAITKGDYSHRITIKANDEFGQMAELLNQVAENLQNHLSTSAGSAQELHDKSAHLDDLMENMNSNFEEISKLTQQMTEGATGLGGTILHVKALLKQLSQLVNTTSIQSIEGEKTLSHMDRTIQRMRGESVEVIQHLSIFQEKVARTRTIIKTTVEVVDQANLLSINSSINAYKTGEKGVGFAVVSEQIKELANQSAFFTLDIETKLNEIRPELEEINTIVESFSKDIEKQAADMSQIKEFIGNFINVTKNQLNIFQNLTGEIENQTRDAHSLSKLVQTQNQTETKVLHTVLQLETEYNYLQSSIQELYSAHNSTPEAQR